MSELFANNPFKAVAILASERLHFIVRTNPFIGRPARLRHISCCYYLLVCLEILLNSNHCNLIKVTPLASRFGLLHPYPWPLLVSCFSPHFLLIVLTISICSPHTSQEAIAMESLLKETPCPLDVDGPNSLTTIVTSNEYVHSTELFLFPILSQQLCLAFVLFFAAQRLGSSMLFERFIHSCFLRSSCWAVFAWRGELHFFVMLSKVWDRLFVKCTFMLCALINVINGMGVCSFKW